MDYEPQDPMYVGILLAFYAGLRRGEICGLRWNDIDFYRNTIPKNRLYRNLTGHLTSEGHLKEATDIINPIITVAYNAYHVNINYCYIADFGR